MEYQGVKLFRHRIITSVLSGQTIKITEIRSKSDYPGLNDAEVSFLQLIGQLTSGSVIEVNQSGTQVNFKPGVVINNPGHVGMSFDCNKARSIGFYIEGILPVVIFGKNKLNLTLRGLSHAPGDVGIDSIVYAQVPLLKLFGVEDVSIKVNSRGGDCEAVICLSPVKKVNRIQLVEPGKIKKVRGVAFTSKMNVQLGNRAAYAAKGLLHSFLPDIWIHTDHYKFGEAALGITLVAESNTGCYLTSEFMANEKSHLEHLESDVPEDMGTLAVLHLLDEVMYGGCVDTSNQALALILMALAPDESKMLLGRVNLATIEILRLLLSVFNVRFTFLDQENPVYTSQNEEEEEVEVLPDDLPKTTIISCIGIDYENMARIAF